VSKYMAEDFKWYSPKEKSKFAISIPNGTSLNINPPLCAQITSHISIGLCEKDHTLIGLQLVEEDGYKVPKSGTIRDKYLIEQIVMSGVRLPARYTIEKDGDLWIGVLEEQQAPVIKQLPKPKKSGKETFHAGNKEADR